MTHKQKSYWAIGGYSAAFGMFFGVAIADPSGNSVAWFMAAVFGVISFAGIITEGNESD